MERLYMIGWRQNYDHGIHEQKQIGLFSKRDIAIKKAQEFAEKVSKQRKKDQYHGNNFASSWIVVHSYPLNKMVVQDDNMKVVVIVEIYIDDKGILEEYKNLEKKEEQKEILRNDDDDCSSDEDYTNEESKEEEEDENKKKKETNKKRKMKQ